MATIRLELMTSGYEEPPFDCGVPGVQRLLGPEVFDSVRMKQAIVYNVLCDDNTIGQMMLTLGWLRDNNYETVYGHNLHACLEIKYIAIAKDYQGQGLGNLLLSFAIQFFEKRCKALPIRCIAFEAVHGKEDWYERKGFKQFEPGMEFPIPNGCIIPMYMDFVDMTQFDEDFMNP